MNPVITIIVACLVGQMFLVSMVSTTTRIEIEKLDKFDLWNLYVKSRYESKGLSKLDQCSKFWKSLDARLKEEEPRGFDSILVSQVDTDLLTEISNLLKSRTKGSARSAFDQIPIIKFLDSCVKLIHENNRQGDDIDSSAIEKIGISESKFHKNEQNELTVELNDRIELLDKVISEKNVRISQLEASISQILAEKYAETSVLIREVEQLKDREEEYQSEYQLKYDEANSLKNSLNLCQKQLDEQKFKANIPT